MARFSMYSGEEIETQSQLANFDSMANVHKPVNRDSIRAQNEVEQFQEKTDDTSNRDRNITMAINKIEVEENKRTSIYNEGKVSSLDLREDSIVPFTLSGNPQTFAKSKEGANNVIPVSGIQSPVRNRLPSQLLRQRRLNATKAFPSNESQSLDSLTPITQQCSDFYSDAQLLYRNPPPPFSSGWRQNKCLHNCNLFTNIIPKCSSLK